MSISFQVSALNSNYSPKAMSGSVMAPPTPSINSPEFKIKSGSPKNYKLSNNTKKTSSTSKPSPTSSNSPPNSSPRPYQISSDKTNSPNPTNWSMPASNSSHIFSQSTYLPQRSSLSITTCTKSTDWGREFWPWMTTWKSCRISERRLSWAEKSRECLRKCLLKSWPSKKSL